jgi:hypothetical protein
LLEEPWKARVDWVAEAFAGPVEERRLGAMVAIEVWERGRGGFGMLLGGEVGDGVGVWDGRRW